MASAPGSKDANVGLTAAMANFVVAARYEDLPAEVAHEARRACINIMGCMLGGASHEMIAAMERALQTAGRPPQATVLRHPVTRTDIFSAAALNGASSSVRAFDDSFAHAIVHPSGPPIAAALAYAEWQRMSGKSFLLSIVLGMEFMCRVSQAIATPPAVSDLGWSQTGLTAGIGAAIATGKLARLARPEVACAIGIAASQACGNRASHGTMTTPLLTAHGAEMGLRATLLAQEGFSAPADGLEHKYGFLNLFADNASGDAIVDELGTHFAMMDNHYKRYPCAIVARGVVDACLGISERGLLAPETIQSVDIDVGADGFRLANKPHPQNHLQAQNSAQHWAIVTLTRGSALLSDGSDDVVTNPDFAALRDLVSMRLDPSLRGDAARVTVHLDNGDTRHFESRSADGESPKPMTDRSVEAKFMNQTDGLLAANKARQMMDMIWNIDQCADIGKPLTGIAGLIDAATSHAA